MFLSAQRRDREWLSALLKNRGVVGLCKIRAVWTVMTTIYIINIIYNFYVCKLNSLFVSENEGLLSYTSVKARY